MKHNFLIVLTGLFCLPVFAWSHSIYPQSYKTVTGIEYLRVDYAPTQMQPAYQAPDGLIWGDFVWQEKGPNIWIPKSLSPQNAEQYCNGIKYGSKSARLPTLLEVSSLRRSMSHDPSKEFVHVPPPYTHTPGYDGTVTGNSTYDNSMPALPRMGPDDGFWTSTSSEENRTLFAYFEPSYHYGLTEYKDSRRANYFRCVLDLK